MAGLLSDMLFDNRYNGMSPFHIDFSESMWIMETEFKSQLMEDPNVVECFLPLLLMDTCHVWPKQQWATGLDLKRQNLTGSISPHLGNLSFLQTINLSENSVTGGIPQELGSLSRLQNLSFSSNFVGGEIPVNLSRCSNHKFYATFQSIQNTY